MRILHTSDWHLGRAFGPYSLESDQQAFTDWIIGQVGEQRIDLVVIAGDVFDRAVASNEAITHFRSVLTAIAATGTQVAVITGNHDGADRVGAYHDLLDAIAVSTDRKWVIASLDATARSNTSPAMTTRSIR
ncbi:MAG: exonuclease SbcCD subunit D, partial [Actinomycetota bacterium]